MLLKKVVCGPLSNMIVFFKNLNIVDTDFTDSADKSGQIVLLAMIGSLYSKLSVYFAQIQDDQDN